jgi:hypothetical protein
MPLPNNPSASNVSLPSSNNDANQQNPNQQQNAFVSPAQNVPASTQHLLDQAQEENPYSEQTYTQVDDNRSGGQQ